MKARLTLKVKASARRTEFAGAAGDVWKLHVAAPPVDGKANEAIIRFLGKMAGVPTASVRIVSGFTGSTKIVEIEGIEREALHRVILESHGPSSNSGSAAARKA